MIPRRIALLHFTSPDRIGGVEAIMRAQMQIGLECGYEVRVVAGDEWVGAPTNYRRVCHLDPSHPDIVRERTCLSSTSLPTHQLARQIADELEEALHDCTDVCVHNVLTVALNPFATFAVSGLIARAPEVKWIAWCYDLSATSAFFDSASDLEPHAPNALRQCIVVTLSETRRSELARWAGLGEETVHVVAPGVPVEEWLSVRPGAQTLIRMLRLGEVDMVILVPGKLLPHKRLDRAIRLAAALKERELRPAMLLTAAASPHQPALSQSVRDHLDALVRKLSVEELVTFLPDHLGREANRSEVRDLMTLADVVFIPSDEEGYGLPVTEAAMLRVPVLCPDLPVFREHPGVSHFNISESIDTVACQALELVRTPANMARRRAMSSYTRFSKAFRELLAV